MIRLIPTTLREANKVVKRLHRHSKPVIGGLFAVGCGERETGNLNGVAIVGRPISRGNDTGWHCEVLRVATDGSANACSMLYSSCANAARNLGYQSIITYTLESEPGTSLVAAGWEDEGVIKLDTWNRASRSRPDTDLFGDPILPQQNKRRWRKWLVKSKRQRAARNRLRGKSVVSVDGSPVEGGGE